jgi:hypothetical protein
MQSSRRARWAWTWRRGRGKRRRRAKFSFPGFCPTFVLVLQRNIAKQEHEILLSYGVAMDRNQFRTVTYTEEIY